PPLAGRNRGGRAASPRAGPIASTSAIRRGTPHGTPDFSCEGRTGRESAPCRLRRPRRHGLGFLRLSQAEQDPVPIPVEVGLVGRQEPLQDDKRFPSTLLATTEHTSDARAR